MARYVSTTENLEIVNALITTLTDMKFGDTLSKERIDNLVRGKPWLLTKAKTVVEQSTGCIFATVIREGVKKLQPADSHLAGMKARKRAVKGMGRAHGQIVGVIRAQYGEMTAQERLKATNEINKLGLAVEFCRE